ncbi:MAG: outer membrane beta-barrel domain-containing protein [Bacteriovoracaceae bacterium]|nr:outer membrane beta-barrel domain-containing protein [Bacteriovoracaceae bacterium]
MTIKFSLCFFVVSFLFLSVVQSIRADEGSIYNFSWLDPDKEVYVLQNRKYRKVSRAHINLGYAHTLSGAFIDAHGLQGRAGFFFTENWGFEGIYSKQSGKENETAASVRNVGGTGSVPFRRITESYMGAMLLWSPFYAKINTFNKIVYMDWIIGIGYATLEEKNNREELDRTVINYVPKSETHGSIMWDMAFKFYFSENWHTRIDLTAIHYKAQKATTTSTAADQTWFSNFDLVVSLGLNIF